MLRVLLATDGSEYSEAGRQLLALMPLPEGSHIEVVSVIDEVFGAAVPVQEGNSLVWHTGEEVRELKRKQAWEWVRTAEAALGREGVQTNGAVRSGDAAHQLLLAAEETAADLIVVGSRGLTGLKGFVLGSVARNVAHHASCPVLVARQPPAPSGGGRASVREVLVAVDGSEHAAKAVAFTRQLPLPAETRILVAHVIRPRRLGHPLIAPETGFFQAMDEAERRYRDQAEQLVGGVVAQFEAGGHPTGMAIREGDPATTLLSLASEGKADLIVAGARGGSRIRGLIVGSVADRLLRAAPCSVLLAH